jgi:hypothetical protein
MSETVGFDRASANRIARVVIDAEKAHTDRGFSPNGPAAGGATETIYAKLTSQGTGSSSLAFAWTEQRRKADGTWEDAPNGRTGTTTNNAAWIAPTNAANVLNQTVLMRRTPYYVAASSNYAQVWTVAPQQLVCIPVRVEKDGGSNGTATSAASYTYTVRDFASGNTLATNAAQVHPRAYGAVDYQAGTNGVGLAYQSGTSVALYLAGEVPQTGPCSEA